MKEIEECENLEGDKRRKKSNDVDGSRWKEDDSILIRKDTWKDVSIVCYIMVLVDTDVFRFTHCPD